MYIYIYIYIYMYTYIYIYMHTHMHYTRPPAGGGGLHDERPRLLDRLGGARHLDLNNKIINENTCIDKLNNKIINENK